MKKNRELVDEKNLLQTVCRLHLEIPSRLSPGALLEQVLEHLGRLVSCQRLAGFASVDREAIEVRLKSAPEEGFTKIRLSLGEAVMSAENDLKKINQMHLLRRTLDRQHESTRGLARLQSLLSSPNLIELPFESQGRVWAQALIELKESERASRDQIEMLKQFAQMAAVALERNHLLEAFDRQSEELARTARKVEQVQKQLHQIERLASVGRLAAGAAHEINNPLTTITAHAHLLLRSVEGEKPQKSLATIKEQAARISKIISDLMGVARPAKPQLGPTDVKTVVESTLGTLEHRFRVAGLDIRTSLPANLPRVVADSRQLEQVFLNLALNAVQAMSRGGTLSVNASLVPGGDQIKISFQDTGRGIPPEKLPLVFEPFYTTKEEGEGAGLGLAISHSIIEAHGGRIEVSSRPGEGSSFTVFLPVSEARMAERGPIETDSGREDSETTPTTPSASVLVIDDEEALRNVLSEALELEGYEVDLARDGEEGLEKLDAKQYQVALLDLRMPRKQGLPVLETVRKDYPSLPVIVISGLAQESEFELARQTGAYACVKKPFDMNDLLAKVKSAIQEN
jgi:signal transduction histidine kinase/ActR/RegA family two-component response regulator